MKTCEEFSNAFDVLWNNIASDRAPGLNSYEKSIFLTKAQNELVKNYFEAASTGNSYPRGFDDSAIRQADFSTLVTTAVQQPSDETPVLDYRATVFLLPSDVLAFVNEQVSLKEDESSTPSLRQVVPLSYHEYVRLMTKPFKEPLKRTAWRLITNGSSAAGIAANKAEIVLSSADRQLPLKSYILRYVRHPRPVVLEDLKAYGPGISVEGVTAQTMCEFDESVHDAILQRAVELAKVSWNGDANETQLQMTAGKRSE